MSRRSTCCRFQQMPKNVFDAQVAFNVLDRYGANSTSSLATVEKRIQSDFEQDRRRAC